MDLTFIEGIAAVAAGIIVFCGSIWLLLAVVLGAKLAYFVTASVTLAFILIMSLVWAYTPLGPVGQMPEWDPVAIGESADELDFGPAAQYPDDPWREANEEDEAELTKKTELEGDATDYLDSAIEEEEVTAFDDVGDATVNTDETRLLQQDGDEYGAVTFEAPQGGEGGSVIAVMRYDPGNPLGQARMIALGVFALFALHVFALSRSERRARPSSEAG